MRATNMNNEGSVLSLEYKNAERNKAIAALEKAKSLNRPVRRAASNECEFSRNLPQKPKEEKEDTNLLLTTKQAAELLHTTTNNLHKHITNGNIESIKVGHYRYFDKKELERFRTTHLKKKI